MFTLTAATPRVGPRIHRSTCSRAKDGIELELAPASDLLAADPATCCKPNPGAVDSAVSVILSARKHASGEMEDILSAREPDSGDTLSADEPDSETPVHLTVAVALSEAKVSKHYWLAFGKGGASTVAESLGVEVAFDNPSQTVFFVGDRANDAREALLALWIAGFADFKEWRRTDPQYKALPSQDTHWATSERYAAEQAWLRGFTAAWAESFSLL